MTRLLDSIHSHHGVLHRPVLRRPFGLRIEEAAPLSVMLAPEAELQMRFDDGTEVVVPAGRVAVIATPEPYLLRDASDVDARFTVLPDRVLTSDGQPWVASVDDVACLVEPGGDTVLVNGKYDVTAGLGGRLLADLPAVAVVDLPNWDGLLALLNAELEHDKPGRQVMLDRWLDLVLVSALRTWFSDTEAAPGWYLALDDAVVGPALRAMHDRPAEGWTTDRLARLAASSRSAFSARFTRLVGEPPMTYLTGLRMDLTTERLLSDDAPLETIANAVGYSSAFALSAAYKRHTGVSPANLRRTA